MTCGIKDCEQYKGEEFDCDELVECCSCTGEENQCGPCMDDYYSNLVD